MKVNVTQVLKNFNGKPLKDNIGTGGKPKLVDLTLRSVLCSALMFTNNKELQAAPNVDERIRRFILAQDIYKNDVVVLRVDDLADLKQRINGLFQTPMVAAAMLILDPPPSSNTEEDTTE